MNRYKAKLIDNSNGETREMFTNEYSFYDAFEYFEILKEPNEEILSIIKI